MKRLFCSLLLSAMAMSSQSSLAIDHALYGGFGFTEGGFSLGIDYEYTGKPDFGLGGYVRMYQKNDGANEAQSPGVTVAGASIRPHFNKKNWDMYLSPGVGIIQIDAINSAKGDATTLGPSLALGLMYDLTGSVSLGVENMHTWVWFDDKYRGNLIDELSFRFRMVF